MYETRTHLMRTVLATAALTGFSACGDTSDPTSPNGAGIQLTETRLYGDIAAYRAVAANRPSFGSVTQSSNGNGITTNRIATSLESGGHLALVVRDGNGGVSLELDSRTDLEEDLRGTAWMSDDGLPSNWSGNGWVLSRQDGSDRAVALVYTLWNNTNSTDYLAGGYWVRTSENDEVTELGTFGDAGPGSVFSYFDEPNPTWERPHTGTATYLGSAEGAFVEPNGDGGVWWSRARIDVDFATQTISGCIGCPEADPSGIESGVYVYTTIEDLKADWWTETDYSLTFDSGRVGSDGSFESTLSALALTSGSELTSQGKWGGLFSENSSGATHPLQMAGTLGGTADGNGFIGVFLGVHVR